MKKIIVKEIKGEMYNAKEAIEEVDDVVEYLMLNSDAPMLDFINEMQAQYRREKREVLYFSCRVGGKKIYPLREDIFYHRKKTDFVDSVIPNDYRVLVRNCIDLP